ncbi:MAG: hypothetical protein HYR66_15915 [Sphingobacteriales bacterium]|nr:hypothetical protein [Sphingobacteriales bacterium]MBI3718433.1 hypothetical protein [Sphingobacteriales bacterium]
MQKIFFLLAAMVSIITTTAQLPVKNEPRHHNIFENNYVRILDVHFLPGDTTLYHLHNTPSVFINFTRTLVGSQLKNQQPDKSEFSVVGSIRYDELSTPRLHRVWNDDSTWYHVMDIELVAGKPTGQQQLLTASSLKLLDNKPLANIYKLQLKKGEKIVLPATSAGYLLISIGDALVNISVKNKVDRRVMKAGHFNWMTAGDEFFITTENEGDSEFALIQLK